MNLTHSALFAALGIATSLVIAADQTIIGLITKTETNPFWVKMKEGAQQAATANGAKLLTAAGKFEGDNAGQVAAIENMVAAGARTILITPSDSKAAGVLIGQYAKAALGGKPARIATLDLFPGQNPVSIQRHNGFLAGFGATGIDAKTADLAHSADVVCMADSWADIAKGQTAMEICLQKNPDINLVYTINEAAAAGANKALKAAGKEFQGRYFRRFSFFPRCCFKFFESRFFSRIFLGYPDHLLDCFCCVSFPDDKRFYRPAPI